MYWELLLGLKHDFITDTPPHPLMICIYLLYVLYICENILHHLLLYGVIPECPWIYKLFYWRCVSCFPFHLHLRQPSERRERPKNPASLTGLFNYYTDGWELIRIILRKLSCLVNSLIFFDFVQHFYLWITKWIKKMCCMLWF